MSVIYLKPIASAFFHLIKVTLKSPSYTRIVEGSYKGLSFSPLLLSDLNKIRSILNNQKDFLNITGYQFLYTDYNIEPPKPMPLWFDYGITFRKNGVSLLVEYIRRESPKIILINEEFCTDYDTKELSISSLKELGYQLIFSTYASNKAGGELIRVLELTNDKNIAS